MFKKLLNAISTAAKTGAQIANVQTILLRNYRVSLEKNNVDDLQEICRRFGDDYNNDELAVIYLLKICSEFNQDHPSKVRTLGNWIRIVRLADGDGVLNKSLVDEFLSIAKSLLDHPNNPESSGGAEDCDAETKPFLFTTEQSFPSESEAKEFADWIRGTSDNPEVTVCRSESGNWLVRSTEKSYQEDDPSGWPRKD